MQLRQKTFKFELTNGKVIKYRVHLSAKDRKIKGVNDADALAFTTVLSSTDGINFTPTSLSGLSPFIKEKDKQQVALLEIILQQFNTVDSGPSLYLPTNLLNNLVRLLKQPA